jgi:hypothetical protein
MKKILSLFFASLALAALSAGATFAQAPAAPASTKASAGAVDTAAIVRAFAAHESRFRRALNEYGFKRDAVIQVIGMGGQVTGEYHRVSHFVMDDSGNRFEKIDFFPLPSFAGVTNEDLEDLGGVNAFSLETSQIDRYNFTYVGKERIDELDLYIFDVAPKVMPNPKKTQERLFVGRIWVDDKDLQIVKAKGKGVPETKDNKFPVVETYREQIDGRYWFPTYAYADDELVFDNGEVMRIRLKVKYTDFEKLHAKVRVIEEGDPGEEAPKQQPPAPATPPPAPGTAKPKP